jgi:putative transposase
LRVADDRSARAQGECEVRTAWYGSRIIVADPAETSQCCHARGTIDVASRISRSRFVCTNCGIIFDADAAKNILKLGISPTGGLPGMACVNRARRPAGSRKKTPAREEARPFRAESSHRAKTLNAGRDRIDARSSHLRRKRRCLD